MEKKYFVIPWICLAIFGSYFLTPNRSTCRSSQTIWIKVCSRGSSADLLRSCGGWILPVWRLGCYWQMYWISLHSCRGGGGTHSLRRGGGTNSVSSTPRVILWARIGRLQIGLRIGGVRFVLLLKKGFNITEAWRFSHFPLKNIFINRIRKLKNVYKPFEAIYYFAVIQLLLLNNLYFVEYMQFFVVFFKVIQLFGFCNFECNYRVDFPNAPSELKKNHVYLFKVTFDTLIKLF